MMAAQFKADRQTIATHVYMAGNLHGAPDAIATALRSADTRDAWHAVYMKALLEVGAEFAGNTQEHIASRSGLTIPSGATSTIKTRLAQYGAQYVPVRVDRMLDATIGFIQGKVATARGQKAAAKIPPNHHADTAPAVEDEAPEIQTMDDLGDFLDYVYHGLTNTTAPQLAEHETATFGNTGQFVGADIMGGSAIEKVWGAVIDNVTRQWHADMNGVSVPLDEPFDVDGEQMMYPLDDSLGATGRNLFGCRCVSYYQLAGSA